jgi:hypothetical protein
MTEPLEQRYCIKFCQKLGDTQAETIRNIQQDLSLANNCNTSVCPLGDYVTKSLAQYSFQKE